MRREKEKAHICETLVLKWLKIPKNEVGGGMQTSQGKWNQTTLLSISLIHLMMILEVRPHPVRSQRHFLMRLLTRSKDRTFLNWQPSQTLILWEESFDLLMWIWEDEIKLRNFEKSTNETFDNEAIILTELESLHWKFPLPVITNTSACSHFWYKFNRKSNIFSWISNNYYFRFQFE